MRGLIAVPLVLLFGVEFVNYRLLEVSLVEAEQPVLVTLGRPTTGSSLVYVEIYLLD